MELLDPGTAIDGTDIIVQHWQDADGSLFIRMVNFLPEWMGGIDTWYRDNAGKPFQETLKDIIALNKEERVK